jgi:hypothetical protein
LPAPKKIPADRSGLDAVVEISVVHERVKGLLERASKLVQASEPKDRLVAYRRHGQTVHRLLPRRAGIDPAGV